MERRADRLLVAAYEARKKRSNGLEDIHEMRHIYAAIIVGNTDDCDPKACKLDKR